MVAASVRSLAVTMLFAPLALTACGGTTISPGGGVRTTDSGFTVATDAGATQGADAAASTGDAGVSGRTDTGVPGASDSGVVVAADSGVPNNPPDAGVQPACTYPGGAVEPMALDQVITPYRWTQAEDLAAGVTRDLDLTAVYCDRDQDLAWSGIDYLLLVSIPAW